MSILPRLWSWLTHSTKRNTKRGHPDLHPLDPEEIIRDLALRKRAAQLGKSGVPSAEQTSLTGPESAALQVVDKARQDYYDWAAQKLAILNSEMGQLDVNPMVDRARNAAREFELAANHLIEVYRPRVQSLAAAYRDAKGELKEFQEQNRLFRPARELHWTARLLAMGVLALFIIVEGVLNAFFFARGLEGGLIEGFLAAAVAATINVLFAALVGRYVLPEMAHVKTHRRWTGIFGGILYVPFALFYALGIGHFRNALGLDASRPELLAWEQLLLSPFGLQDMFSWMLVAITLLFAIFALVDGYLTGDPYPGYERVSKRCADAQESFQEEFDYLQEELDALRQSHLDSVDRIAIQMRAIEARQIEVVTSKAETRHRLETALIDAKNCLATLLTTFRNENEIHREGPPPEYFDRLPEFEALPDLDLSTVLDERKCASQRRLLRQLLSEIPQLRNSIQERFVRARDSTRPLAEHFTEEE